MRVPFVVTTSMYRAEADATMGSPKHWHYISFGLSDLHGDGRVHKNIGTVHSFDCTVVVCDCSHRWLCVRRCCNHKVPRATLALATS